MRSIYLGAYVGMVWVTTKGMSRPTPDFGDRDHQQRPHRMRRCPGE